MKRKQIIVLGLVLVITAVGILQYHSGGSGDSGDLAMTGNYYFADGDEEPEDIPGAAVYVKARMTWIRRWKHQRTPSIRAISPRPGWNATGPGAGRKKNSDPWRKAAIRPTPPPCWPRRNLWT